MSFENFRRAFAADPALVHLDNADLSPVSLRARDTAMHWAGRYAAEGVFCGGDYLRAVKAARASLARLLGFRRGAAVVEELIETHRAEAAAIAARSER